MNLLGAIGGFLGGPLGGAIGGFLGGGLDMWGEVQARRDAKDMAYHTSQVNTDNMREQMAFQKEQNQKAMDFSERMSNTSWQRAIADMESAGLNPMLAYSQGGASSSAGVTSAGSAASGVTAAPHPVRYGQAISSAMQARVSEAQIKTIESQARKSNAEALVAEATVPSIAAETRLRTASAVASERMLSEQIRKLTGEANSAEGRGALDMVLSSFANRFGDLENLKRTAEAESAWYSYENKLPVEVRRLIASAILEELKIPGARREAEVDESAYGRQRPIIRDAGLFGHAAASAYLTAKQARSIGETIRKYFSQEPAKAGEARFKWLPRPSHDVEVYAP